MEKIAFHHYRDADYLDICDFLIALNRSQRTHINWNWARFEWMVGHPDFDRSTTGSMGLWRCEGTIVGAALYDMYFGEAFCGVLPGYEALYPEVLDYAYRELKDDSGLGIAICDSCAWEIEKALCAGFSPAEQTETILCRQLEGLSRAQAPSGLHLREMDAAADGEALQWLLWQGFDHGNDRAEFERAQGPLPPARPHFDRRLSLAAVNEQGEGVAYCCLWYQPGTDYAYVEPVCTIPAWRGKGAARSILTEAMLRARTLGAKRAYVISDQEFYRRLGFESDSHFTFYWKK